MANAYGDMGGKSPQNKPNPRGSLIDSILGGNLPVVPPINFTPPQGIPPLSGNMPPLNPNPPVVPVPNNPNPVNPQPQSQPGNNTPPILFHQGAPNLGYQGFAKDYGVWLADPANAAIVQQFTASGDWYGLQKAFMDHQNQAYFNMQNNVGAQNPGPRYPVSSNPGFNPFGTYDERHANSVMPSTAPAYVPPPAPDNPWYRYNIGGANTSWRPTPPVTPPTTPPTGTGGSRHLGNPHQPAPPITHDPTVPRPIGGGPVVSETDPVPQNPISSMPPVDGYRGIINPATGAPPGGIDFLNPQGFAGGNKGKSKKSRLASLTGFLLGY